MTEEAQRPGKTLHLNRLSPDISEATEVIASQLISINAHLASIAESIEYLTEAIRQEQKHVD